MTGDVHPWVTKQSQAEANAELDRALRLPDVMSAVSHNFLPMSRNHPLTPEQIVALTREIELLLEYGVSLSQGHTGTPATYLEQQASIAFAKCLMSLIGFLRFVPPSKYWAKEVVEVVDLSSSSVMARQFIEDAVVFFYFNERGLSDEELGLRQSIGLFHGIVEAGQAAKLADSEAPIVTLFVFS